VVANNTPKTSSSNANTQSQSTTSNAISLSSLNDSNKQKLDDDANSNVNIDIVNAVRSACGVINVNVHQQIQSSNDTANKSTSNNNNNSNTASSSAKNFGIDSNANNLHTLKNVAMYAQGYGDDQMYGHNGTNNSNGHGYGSNNANNPLMVLHQNIECFKQNYQATNANNIDNQIAPSLHNMDASLDDSNSPGINYCNGATFSLSQENNNSSHLFNQYTLKGNELSNSLVSSNSMKDDLQMMNYNGFQSSTSSLSQSSILLSPTSQTSLHSSKQPQQNLMNPNQAGGLMQQQMLPIKLNNISSHIQLSNISLSPKSSASSTKSTSSSVSSSGSYSGNSKRCRSSKKDMPDQQKDIKYFERRKRNNVAAKKSRDARKQREDEIAIRASFLEKENAILKAQLQTLKDEAQQLRILLAQKKSTNSACTNCNVGANGVSSGASLNSRLYSGTSYDAANEQMLNAKSSFQHQHQRHHI